MPRNAKVSTSPYRWAAWGDVNAFFGLMLDNIAQLIITVSLLSVAFEFPTDFALGHMVPGTAVGVVVGDLLFFLMAMRLARHSGRNDVTAMPLGIDTPSVFGITLFVIGPAYLAALAVPGASKESAALHAWHIGICALLISGLFKFACSFGSGWIRRVVPRAGLLGSLAAIALVLISFLPLVTALHYPIVGFLALAIILTTLVAKVPMPGRLPGAFGALLVGGAIYLLMWLTGTLPELAASSARIDPAQALWPQEWKAAFRFDWLAAMESALPYLPIALPFALGTIVGGIDCTESAAAAGDEYHTGRVIAVEALATIAAALCGGVIQTTPYIGHPAYKAMGGRSAYVLATALFVGAAGLIGFFAYLYLWIPKPALYPILVFIGLEITAQSFLATPKRHYAAVALACVPALAFLAISQVDGVMGELVGRGVRFANLSGETQDNLLIIRVLSAGFIVTSLLWSSTLAYVIDRRLGTAAVFLIVAALLSWLGVIHSPLSGSPVMLPTSYDASLPEMTRQIPWRFALAYLATAGLLLGWGAWLKTGRQEAER